jgi:hypothetical protein
MFLLAADAVSLWVTLLSVAIGAGAAIGGGAFASWFTWQHERQALASAFAGEVRGFLEVVDWREAREGLLQGKNFPIDDHPFPVFEANVGKIGLLPKDLAGKVAGFYSYARGIVQDFRALWSGKPIDRERLVKGLNDLKNKADALVPELLEEAGRTWRDYLFRELPFPSRQAS